MPMYTKSGRSLWPVIVGALAAVVLALAVLLVVVARDNGGDDQGAASVTATPTGSQSPQTPDAHEGQPGEDAGPELDQAPTGCLAGPGVDAEMVITTQARAPHTAYGAVEVAASFVRWSNQYPFTSAEQNAAIKGQVLSSSGPAASWDLNQKSAVIQSTPELRDSFPPGPEPLGTSFTVSTRPGGWLVDPSSTADRVTVHLSVGVVIDGALSTGTYTVGSPVLAWENGAWRVVDVVPTATAALEAGGVGFTGGC